MRTTSETSSNKELLSLLRSPLSLRLHPAQTVIALIPLYLSQDSSSFLITQTLMDLYSQRFFVFPTLPEALVSSVQLLHRVRIFATPWIAACQVSLSITNFRSLLKLMSIELVMPSSHLILCRPLLLLSPIPLSIRVFSNESTLHMRWPKYWSFSFSISPSSEHPGLISFRMDGLNLLAVQGTLKNLLQHHSSEASIFWCSAFFTVQLSHPYMITGKTTAPSYLLQTFPVCPLKPKVCHQ